MTFLLRRIIDSLIAIWGVATIVFVITRMIGDPAAILLPIGSPESELIQLRRSLGLDQPILVQYWTFLTSALHGDFGVSFLDKRDAMAVVLERVPATAALAGIGLFFGVLIGGGAGSIAARHPGTIREMVVLFGALIGQSVPSFWIGLMLILIFAVGLGWLPTSGYGTWQHLVLPSIVLSLFVSASIARLLRASLLDAATDDHVRTARAKGLSGGQVFRWHVLRNSLLPVVTVTSLLAGELLGGAVVLETVFSWPGLGRLMAQAIETRDFPVLQAGVIVIAIIFVVLNLVTDFVYGLLDPRIGLGG
jgi:peptide/nickel transport system permease protein